MPIGTGVVLSRSLSFELNPFLMCEVSEACRLTGSPFQHGMFGQHIERGNGISGTLSLRVLLIRWERNIATVLIQCVLDLPRHTLTAFLFAREMARRGVYFNSSVRILAVFLPASAVRAALNLRISPKIRKSPSTFATPSIG
jgi:hypothetical protein